MKANTRTRENCWRSACTSSSVKWLNPATDPDTSHSTTSSGRAGRGLFSTTSIGTPPVDMDLRSVLRRSIVAARGERRRRAASRVAKRAGQRRDDSSHLAQLFTGGAQELDVLGKLWDAVHLDVVAAELLGGAPLGLGVDHFAQLRDPLVRQVALAICSWVGVGSSPYGREQPGQQPALQLVERHRLERLIRRERRAAAGAVFAVGLDDLRDHRDQPLVHVCQLRVVGEQVRAASARIASTSSAGSASSCGSPPSSSTTTVARAQCRGEPQVEHRVVGLAVVGPAQHRAGDALAQHLAIAQAERGHHPAGVHRLRRAHRNPLRREALPRTRPSGRAARAGQAVAAGRVRRTAIS